MKTVTVKFELPVPPDLTEEDIEDFIKFEIRGGMLRPKHPAVGKINLMDAEWFDFEYEEDDGEEG